MKYQKTDTMIAANNKKAITEKQEQQCATHCVSNSLPSEIYLTYDRSDGEVFCAFVDKEQCKREAEESGCGMQTVRLVG